jgi:ribose 5-phosphate isomerase RpiB
MIFTARQLEELYKSNGKITLPYRARLTPLAQDWLKQKKIDIGYSDGEAAPRKNPADIIGGFAGSPVTGNWLWWADGPCGPAKAALLTVARESNIRPTEIGVDPKRIAEAVKIVAHEVKAGKAMGGILLVSNGAAAMVFANRCPSLRAVLGTCIEAVDQAVKLVAANVIVIEHPYKSLQQVKTLLGRFLRGKRELTEDVKQQLSELSSCE